MTAPALVLLAPGHQDARVTDVMHGLRKGLQGMRSELTVQLAFLGQGSPGPSQVLARLQKQNVPEVALVPLDLCRAFAADDSVQSQAGLLRAEFPNIQLALARPIGPEATLLNLVDRRLRDSLSRRHVSELDGLVLSAGDPGDSRSASLFQRRARQWSLHHKLPVVTATTADGSTDIADAMRTLWAQGRRHVAVGSWFIAADDDYQLQAEAARRLGAAAVSAPFGSEAEVLDLTLARYVVAAMSLISFDDDSDDGDDSGRHLHMVGA